MSLKKFKGWLHARLAEFQGQTSKVNLISFLS